MATRNTNLNWEPPKLDLSVDKHSAFKLWKERYTDYCVVTKLADEDAAYRCSTLRYTFTEETRKIYNTLGLTEAEQANDTTIIAKLEEYSKGTVNQMMERYLFFDRDQDDGECCDDFITDIKHLSKNCNFCDTCGPSLIRDRIVGGIKDSSLRQKLLSDPDLDLKKAEDQCRAKEKAVEGTKLLSNNNNREERGDVDVDELSNRFSKSRPFQPGNRGRNRDFSNNNRRDDFSSNNRRDDRLPRPDNPCRFCTRFHQWGRQHCPAWEKSCSVCGVKNHLKGSKVCKKRRNIRNVNQYDSEDEEEDLEFLFLGLSLIHI